MNSLKYIFLHPTQNRLRLLWRLGLFAFLLGTLTLFFQVLSLALSTALGRGMGFVAADILNLTLSVLSAGAAITATVWLANRFLDKRSFKILGFSLSPLWWKDLAFGLGLGAALQLLIFLSQLALGWIKITPRSSSGDISLAFSLLTALIFYVAVGFYEELLSRGYLLKNLAEGFSGPLSPPLALSLAAFLTSIGFGLAHAANPNATFFAVLNIILAGLTLAAGLLLTGQLALSIGFHISWNFMQGPILGFPVSGFSLPGRSLMQTIQGGPSLWTGGPFGPEGGLLAVLALGLGLILLYTAKRGGIQTSLSAYQPRSPKPQINGIIQE